MNNGARAAAALMALAGWVLLSAATVGIFSVGASLWLLLGHAGLADVVRALPWRNGAWALAAGAAWLFLRKQRLRVEKRISAEQETWNREATVERMRNGRIYQWFLIAVTCAIVLTAWSLHDLLASHREQFNEILLWLLGAQVFLTLGTFAFFTYGVDIRRPFGRKMGPRRNE
ncbi:hypothetical protein [Methylacidimicrobium tartarophylax]|uniref:Uncharacterized protein n=1 Tax=Methylacidimicrobium tartarophylax TaxID=1041768 RepID=A0A5E6M7Y2_9BACT|nr:hypothetical protein [Methylacidimicrobium tartarophylax]VVM04500.1 hypothetical protein MAMT_00130 [Methylacidimicrobium tartarophylax]